MSIQESYPVHKLDSKNYVFESIGDKGTIIKIVLYERLDKNRYNLAFGDFINGDVNDEIISNNNDITKVISTVARTIYDFTEENSEAIIEIKGVDAKRTRFYNTVFKRRFLEIKETFFIVGIVNDLEEEYNPNQFYEAFEIKRKKL